MPRPRRPWYGFLYYALGAQGSFLLWILSIGGIYFTWRDAALYLVNPAPRPATVAEIVEGRNGLKRWVRVAGVEIDLGSALVALSAGGSPEARTATADAGWAGTILADPEDPAAVAWWELFRRVDELRAERPGEPEEETTARLIELWSLLQEVGSEREWRRYVPKRAIVVVDQKRAEARASAPAAPGAGGATEDIEALWRRRTAERVDLFRSAVRVDVTREGLLARPREELERRYRERHGVEVARSALVVGDRPSPHFTAVFGVSAFFLLFLIAGLRALRQAPETPAGA